MQICISCRNKHHRRFESLRYFFIKKKEIGNFSQNKTGEEKKKKLIQPATWRKISQKLQIAILKKKSSPVFSKNQLA